MATVNVTNRVAFQALNGQSVRITLDGTDSANLSSFAKGQAVAITGTTVPGVIESVDRYGHSFLVTPKNGIAFSLAPTATPGILNASVAVTVTI